ncbi:transglutaminase family protein [Novosphingobium acidiphilum]|uniref:transglutaminase family protein n=1 Tax=Novosphingobium acidiphilum TaxID=505248 RepID=UPI0003F953AD|nr:transglutaminase family protein [Novosphingobium acidiphilum]
MRLAIEHATTYRFSGPIRQGQQRLRLTPVSSAGQSVIAWDIACEGAQIEVGYDDEYTNRVTLVGLTPGTPAVTIRAHGVVETRDESGVTGRHAGYLPLWHFSRDTALTARGTKVAALVGGLENGAARDPLATLHTLTERVRAAVVYAQGHTDVATTAEAALTAGRGVCQDQAHVFIAGARALGIPARYVSGYMLIDGREQQDAGHGWAEGFVDGLGWIGFDVANAICPDDRYVRVACGRDYRDAAPVKSMTYVLPAPTGSAPVGDTLVTTLVVQRLTPA